MAVGEKPGFEQRARIPSVDGLRALAFTLVFLFHSWEFAGRPRIPVVTDIVAQNTRPDLFVVLTGFALYLPFALDPSRHGRFRTGAYVERRIKRIVLPYYAALALALVLPYVLKVIYSLLGQAPNPTDPVAWGDVASHLTFTHMFFPEYWAGINGSLWTMSLEMQLYLLFPVVVLLVARWGLWALVPLSAVSVLWHVVTPFGDQWPEDFLWGATAIGRLTEFMAGMVAAVIVMRLRHRLTRRWLLAALVVFVLGYAVATGSLTGGRIPVREVGLSVAFGGLIVLAIGAKPVEAFFGSRPVARLGYMAYSMFLVHQPIVYYFSEGLERVLGVPEGHGELALLWSVGFAVVFVVGWLFFRFIEEPCIRWSKAVAKRPASAASTPL
ncbi:acyltransferase family protein [Ornithinimicrobium kibberense]|uniref:Acyltransferase family protein n=1 Tax=Ornithinimicrobium kibberense TaxID=282060 RepID=A0ABV5V2I5_9MICO|nr:acyltransferase [Ornithinimicrobium kibberense]